ncbi:MAG: MGMT family protein [Verrucomicrobiota bacterium]
MTEFQTRVYEAVKLVPRGKVATYTRIGSIVGCGSARAVGQALKENPFSPQVPCHRVIASDLSLGGFRGRIKGKALMDKKNMLQSEGVVFVRGKIADKGFLWRP